MRTFSEKMKLQYAQGTWTFIDPSPKMRRLAVEQVVIDATLTRLHYVEGYVKSVTGWTWIKFNTWTGARRPPSA